MIVALLELRQSIHEHERLYLFTVFVMLTWMVWLVKVMLSRRYRPWPEPFVTSTTVVIPVVDEPLDLFRDVLTLIVEQAPTQILVVINGPRNVGLEEVCGEFDAVEWRWTPVAGKRNAVRVGVAEAIGDIVVLVDSDTIWTEATLSELVKPFADEAIGGVTTRQRILDPKRCFLTRWADWIENSRAMYSMPAQSALGQVGCLPGRTIAFRRSVLEEAMEPFMTEEFLGVFMEVSDDRTLTNLTLKQGYRTVYQSTSLVYTDAPTGFRKFVKQQYRWARGSQYNTLRMLRWMARHTPVLGLFFVIDILLPFIWLCSALGWVIRTTDHHTDNLYGGLTHLHGDIAPFLAIVTLTVLTSTLSMCLRQQRHLEQVPSDVFRMPFFVMFSTLVLMPIRMVGFVRLAHQGSWGTRENAYDSGDSGPAVDDVLHGAPPGPGGSAATSGPPLEAAVVGSAGPGHPGVALVSPPAALSPPVATEGRALPNVRALLPIVLALIMVVGGTLYDARPT